MIDQQRQEIISSDSILRDSLDVWISENPAHVPEGYAESLKHSLSTEQARQVVEKIEDMFSVPVASPKKSERMAAGDDGNDEINAEEQHRWTGRLREILTAVVKLWWSDSNQLEVAAEKLADGSRNVGWRLPLGDSGILAFFLEILGSRNNLRRALKIHILRLVGNSCADTDANRARVVASQNYLPSIIAQLKVSSLLPFAIPVLFNICVDYEPAQALASKSLLTKELIELISGPMSNDAAIFLEYVGKLLAFMALQPSDLELAPENTATVLLQIAAKPESSVDITDLLSILNVAVAYLQRGRFQRALIDQEALDMIISILRDSYTRFDQPPSNGLAVDENDDEKALIEIRSALNQVLSDLSALPEFQEACPVVSSFSSTLQHLLNSPHPQLVVCGCIMLGNLARSDTACIEFVQTSLVHKPLVRIISESTSSQVLHAALGFLKNLAMPLANKLPLGDAGILESLPRLWALDTLPQVQFSSISLARQLVIGTFENVRRICERLDNHEDATPNKSTRLSILIALFDRTDAEPVKMEIARLISSICRVINTSTGPSIREITRVRNEFFQLHVNIEKPLGLMISQSKWPVVRSEGWFVFALMARYPEGARCISHVLQDAAVFDLLSELLTGKPASNSASITAINPEITKSNADFVPFQPQSQPRAQTTDMMHLERENALVLISELLKNNPSVTQRTLLEGLLKRGGQLLLTYQNEKPN